MTPNGALVFAFVMGIAAVTADAYGIVLIYVALAAFAVVEVGRSSATALWRAAILMAPFAAFMLIVWVGMVGRSPQEIAAGIAGSRGNALAYVGMIVARLF